ncbi:HAD family hydrolase [bacterium]|nr:HAD family hydrolase [bacterium]
MTAAPPAPVYREIAPGLRARTDISLPALESLDAVLFDIDGVLVEVSDSFRSVISLAVQHFFNKVLGQPGETILVSPDETALFKLAGRYNNDWDLAAGASAWGLLKLLCRPEPPRDIAELREGAPTLEEFTGRIKVEGGGLEVTLRLVRAALGPEKREEFDRLYRPELVRRIFQEYYAGPRLCRPFYGFDPEYFEGPGLVEHERPIIDISLVERLSHAGVAFGILSGRTPEEADYVLASLGLARLLHPRGRVVDDGHLTPKPDPDGLLHLAREMGFDSAVYVGDVPDDWSTVLAYGRAVEAGQGRVSGCMVATGANPGGRISAHFEREGSHWLATDVNTLLRAMLQARIKD